MQDERLNDACPDPKTCTQANMCEAFAMVSNHGSLQPQSIKRARQIQVEPCSSKTNAYLYVSHMYVYIYTTMLYYIYIYIYIYLERYTCICVLSTKLPEQPLISGFVG